MKTAIEILLEKMDYRNIKIEFPKTFAHLCDEVMEIERQQIIIAWENGALPDFIKENKCSRDYFEKTYKKH